MTARPRLLKDGVPSISPAAEGFKDPHVLNASSRVALDYTKDGRSLFLVSCLSSLSLPQEAKAMKVLSTWLAMNLDGGLPSFCLALAPTGQQQIGPVDFHRHGSIVGQPHILRKGSRFAKVRLVFSGTDLTASDAVFAQPLNGQKPRSRVCKNHFPFTKS
ncbi:MAG: phosphodiester glycosidase family protein [Candidatus Sericytochromatia bacterium]